MPINNNTAHTQDTHKKNGIKASFYRSKQTKTEKIIFFMHFFAKTLARLKKTLYLCNVKMRDHLIWHNKNPGEVAEWSIAPVLKTDVLKGTGGSNPSLSARNQEQRKLLLILFYVDTGSLLTSRHIKQNQHKHRQVVADFLHRSPKQGWASEAKPIPTQIER